MADSEDHIIEKLREQFGHGDPEFMAITIDEMKMYNAKNKDYAGGVAGDTVDPNGNFNRVASIFSMYPGLGLGDPRVIAMTYAMKQIDQVLWSLSRGYEGNVEGLDARLADIHIYTKIIRVLNRRSSVATTAQGYINRAMHVFKGPFTKGDPNNG